MFNISIAIIFNLYLYSLLTTLSEKPYNSKVSQSHFLVSRLPDIHNQGTPAITSYIERVDSNFLGSISNRSFNLQNDSNDIKSC